MGLSGNYRADRVSRRSDGLRVTAQFSGLEYGAEIRAGGRTWLLYNGDDFGATGFGVAELLEP